MKMPSFVVEIVKTITICKLVRVRSAKDATDAGLLIAGRADTQDTAVVTVRVEWQIEKVGKAVVRNVYERRTDGYIEKGVGDHDEEA